MLNAKLARIKELIAQKEVVDAELEALIGGAEPLKARRGRPPKPESNPAQLSLEEGTAQE